MGQLSLKSVSKHVHMCVVDKWSTCLGKFSSKTASPSLKRDRQCYLRFSSCHNKVSLSRFKSYKKKKNAHDWTVKVTSYFSQFCSRDRSVWTHTSNHPIYAQAGVVTKHHTALYCKSSCAESRLGLM